MGPRRKRRPFAATSQRVMALGVIACAFVVVACTDSNDGSQPDAPALEFSEELPTFPAGEVMGGDGCGVDAPPDGGAVAAAPGSPFEAAGARQVPGPATTVTTIVAAPVSVVVVSPPNPDLPSAAAQESGTGAPTPTYVTGAPAPPTTSAPSTTAPAASSTSSPPAGCEDGL